MGTLVEKRYISNPPPKTDRIPGRLPQINPDNPKNLLPKPLKNVGGVAPKGDKYAQDVANGATSSAAGLFRRDLMAHLAKPGWFDE